MDHHVKQLAALHFLLTLILFVGGCRRDYKLSSSQEATASTATATVTSESRGGTGTTAGGFFELP